MNDTPIKEELPSTFVRLTQLVLLDMPSSIVCAVPKLIPSLFSLSFLRITVETLGEADLQVLGNLPSLGALYIWVKKLKPAQGREGRSIIGSGYPFRCLTKLSIGSRTEIMKLVFTEGAMQQLQTLKLSFIVKDVTRQYGDLGLEKLSSLEHVSVINYFSDDHMKKAESRAILRDQTKMAVYSAIQKALIMNPNKPTLNVEAEVTNQFTLYFTYFKQYIYCSTI
jgi:hypothetical protein